MKNGLPQRFAGMVLYNSVLSSSQEIATRFNIPGALADYYHRQGVFFNWLKGYRDYVSHSGKSFDLVFLTEKGFAISIEKPPFLSLSIWDEKNTLPNNLGSIKSAVAYVIHNTLKALEDFTETIQLINKLPPDIAPEYKVFMRGKHTKILFESQNYINGAAWHEDQ